MLPLCTLLAAALVPFAGAAGLGLQPRSPAKSYSRRDTPDQACGFTNPVSGSRGLKTVHRLQVSDDLPRRKEHEPVIVKVNLHAGLPSNATDDYVSAEQLYRQFEVLKKEYAPYDIFMELGNITRNLDNRLTSLEMEFDDEDDLSGSTPAIEAWWKRRRTGDYKTLNIFVYEKIQGAQGLCNFPDEDRTPENYYLDACHIVADSIPGSGSDSAWNAGGAAVHEVGHWFGLLHVWSDDCDDEGDLVGDTAQQTSPSIVMNDSEDGRCALKESDSCPGKPGKDNANNFMDYAGDDCAEEFTLGQRARMHNVYHSIRSKMSSKHPVARRQRDWTGF